MLVGVGIVLAVGVHPIDTPSPLMSLLTNDDGSGLALALRSSTRAVPVLLLGVALGAGALAAALPVRPLTATTRSLTPRRLAIVAIGLLAVVNLPVLQQRGFVDEAIDRDQDPPTYWTEAADRIDERADGTRVLQLPGAEFGSFRWGQTTDQPLVGLGSTPLVTRDLLPLGSAAAMDLLFALDDRVQEGTIEPEAVAPTARLLGANTILLTNDMAFESYRTARPEIIDALLTGSDVAGLADVERLGAPVVNRSDFPMIDPTSLLDDRIGQPISPLTLIGVDDPQPVIRAKTDSVVLSGSGDGIVDAAAGGLLDGSEAIRYSASLTSDELSQAVADAELVIVTDSNRDRAHHWRGSQDVHGHTEPGGPDDDVLVATAADQRLELFATQDSSVQTIAVQDGPVRATASSYGEPFAYRPEDRAVMAIDGDRDTAWSVGDHGQPVGERIRLDIDEPGSTTVTLHQIPPAPGGRTITSVRLTVDDDETIDVDLGDASLSADGQDVSAAAFSAMRSLEIEITGVSQGDQAVAASRSGVGFTEIDLGRGPTTELIRVPIDALSSVDDAPLAIVLTRLRTDPTDPWRSDPEPTLVRSIPLDEPRQFDADVTLRLDPDADDGAIAALLGASGSPATALADRRLDGAVEARGVAAVDGEPDTAWVTPFDGAIGAMLTFDASEPLQTLELVQPTGQFSPITTIRVGNDTTGFDLSVPPPDALGRSTVALPAPLAAGPTTLTITGIDAQSTVDRRYGDVLTLPAGIAELSAPGITTADIDADTTINFDCVDDLLSVDGEPIPVSFSTTAESLLSGEAISAEVCNGPIAFDAGDNVLASTAIPTGPLSALSVDRVVLRDSIPDPTVPAGTPIGVTVQRNDARHRTVVVDACPDGCWLVLGEGYNDAWAASVGRQRPGRPRPRRRRLQRLAARSERRPRDRGDALDRSGAGHLGTDDRRAHLAVARVRDRVVEEGCVARVCIARARRRPTTVLRPSGPRGCGADLGGRTVDRTDLGPRRRGPGGVGALGRPSAAAVAGQPTARARRVDHCGRCRRQRRAHRTNPTAVSQCWLDPRLRPAQRPRDLRNARADRRRDVRSRRRGGAEAVSAASSPEFTRERMGHVPALDGIRGLAVLAVIAHHLGHLRGGYLGVDAFFVLSGFLITGLLVDEVRFGSGGSGSGGGRIDLGRFWTRRVKRLFPALALVVVVVVLVESFLLTDPRASLRREVLSALLYVYNWNALADKIDYWSSFASPSPLQHMWSLAIEEQFYLVWPLVVVGVIWWVRRRAAGRAPNGRPDRAVWIERSVVAIGVTAAVLAITSVVIAQIVHDPENLLRVYYGTDTRIAAILFGAVAAVVIRLRPPLSVRGQRIAGFVGLALLVPLAVAWVALDGTSAVLYRGGLVATGIGVTLVVTACVVAPSSLLNRLDVDRPVAVGGARQLRAVPLALAHHRVGRSGAHRTRRPQSARAANRPHARHHDRVLRLRRAAESARRPSARVARQGSRSPRSSH